MENLNKNEVVKIATETVIGLMKNGWKCEVITSDYSSFPTLKLTKFNGKMHREFAIPITNEIQELINIQNNE